MLSGSSECFRSVKHSERSSKEQSNNQAMDRCGTAEFVFPVNKRNQDFSPATISNDDNRANFSGKPWACYWCARGPD